ncbi:MAG: hypothetical protein WCT05_04420 [Lentisphaeria bacterium]
MTPEQNLIQQITRVIENHQLEKNSLLEELAAQYAELCSITNTRLLRCSEYLQKGLLSEAVYDAKIAPDLLELASLVQFDLAKKWQVICEDLELSKAPLLHTEVIEQLRTACIKEKELQPLLREFRSLIYQGLSNQAIGVLRKIRALDPDNSSWIANLQTYEEAELPFWLGKAHQALENMDLPGLRDIHAELTHPQRVVAPPPAILQQLKRALLSEKASDLSLEADNMLNRLQEEISRSNVSAVRQILEQGEKMESKEAFYRRPEVWDEQLSMASAWLEKEDKENRLQSEFEEEIKQVKAILNSDPFTENELKHAWNHLQNWGRPFPEELQKKVEVTLASLQEQRLTRRRHRQQFLAAVVFVVLLAAGWGAVKYQKKRQLQRIQEELELDYRNAKFSEMQQKLENLQHYKPRFFQAVEIQNISSKLASALSERGERTRLAHQYLADLEEIQRQGYQRSEDDVLAFLAEAEKLILTETEKAAISNWKMAWLAWKTGQRRESNAVLQRVCNQFRVARGAVQNANDPDFDLEQQKIQELRLLFQSVLPHLPRAEDIFKADYQQCMTQLEDWQGDLQLRQQQMAEQDSRRQEKQQQFAQLTREIFAALPNLQLYRKRLEQLQEFHQGKMPLEYLSVLGNLEQQSRALALQNFSMRTFPCLPQQENDLRSFLAEGGSALGSVWEADLRKCQEYLDKRQQVLRKIRMLALEQERMFQVYVIEIRKKDAVDWSPLYVPSLPSSREVADNKGNTYTLYWGNMYHVEAADEEPVETHTSKVFPDGLNSREYDVKIGRKPQDCLSSQGKFLMNFIMDAQHQTELDCYLLEALQKLKDPALEMELIPRTWLQKRLLNFLADNYADAIPESLEWVTVINKIDTNVPWMNPKHPQMLAAMASIREAGRFYPDLQGVVARLQWNRELLARALSRRIQCVGALQRDEKGNLAPFLCVPVSGQLWVLATPSLHSPAYWQILSDDGGNLLPEVLRNAYQGQLIFAPQASSFPALQLPAEQIGINIPHSWPSNDPSLGL